MTEQEAKILHLETSVDDLLAGNQRLREERDQLRKERDALVKHFARQEAADHKWMQAIAADMKSTLEARLEPRDTGSALLDLSK